MTKCKRLSNKCAAWGIAIPHFESFNLEQIKSASKPLENDKFTFKFNLGAVSHSQNSDFRFYTCMQCSIGIQNQVALDAK